MTFTAIGTVLVLLWVAWRHRDSLEQRLRYVVKGLATGAILTLGLLVYPAWLALDGPGHFSGTYLPNVGIDVLKRLQGTNLTDMLFPAPSPPSAVPIAYRFGGYLGPSLSFQYFGFGMAVIIVAGLLIWRRDVRLWFFAGTAAISAVLSLGVSNAVPLPWNVLQNLPLFQNVIPYRFIFITYLSVAVMLALIVDHSCLSVMKRRRDAAGDGSPWRRPSFVARIAGLAIACIALAEPAIYLSQNIPVTAVSTTVPTWFQKVAPHLTRRQVVLTLPAPSSQSQALTGASAMTWQAVNGMSFSMILQQESDRGFTTPARVGRR